jgi:nuclear pore complex protein Nup98-Nup96
LLTGHQVETASTTAADGGYFKLSTLISQAGGDETFKEDILSQLDIWKTEKLSPGSNSLVGGNGQSGLVGRGVWRIYNVLSGLVHEQEESDKTREESVFVGLDWRRVFGMCLWYGTSVDASVADVVAAYERILLHNSRGPAGDISRPVPKWVAGTASKPAAHSSSFGSSAFGFPASSSRAPRDATPEDPLYVLIKLYANPALSLSSALNPLSFAPAPLDVGIAMSWHLYIILSRVMKIRDFADRTDSHAHSGKSFADALKSRPRTSIVNGTGRGRGRGSLPSPALTEEEASDAGDEDGVHRDGHSPSADLLASSYAFELESWGMIQEAAFVLLHIEGGVGSVSNLDLLTSSLILWCLFENQTRKSSERPIESLRTQAQ